MWDRCHGLLNFKLFLISSLYFWHPHSISYFDSLNICLQELRIISFSINNISENSQSELVDLGLHGPQQQICKPSKTKTFRNFSVMLMTQNELLSSLQAIRHPKIRSKVLIITPPRTPTISRLKSQALKPPFLS